ncbi:MAG TPA: hypothetical protein VFK05_13890 [Polyangiaceae bacterium]|nr:hypothetical protein [Polyangiaceae bacterium]
MTSRTLRYLFAALAIGLIFLVCCTQADARSPFWWSRPARPPYTFSLEDENGNSLATFTKDGRTFALGEPGERYNIRIHNPTSRRVEAVVSVDGRDAVSGEPGDYVNQRGYVIPAYGSVLVEGFRRSLDEVAAFRFTSPEDSYSARMGTPQNVGVIGVAFFAERVRPPEPVIRRPRPAPRPAPRPYDYFRDDRSGELDSEAPAPRSQKPAAPAAGAAAASEGRAERAARPRAEAKAAERADEDARNSRNNLGTEFGESRESVVSSVAFERASPTHPALLSTLRYDDADGLSARGIDLSGYYRNRWRAPDEPQAFPVSRFAQPPPP